MSKKSWIGGLILALVFLTIVISAMGNSIPGTGGSGGLGNHRIQVIHIQGVIAGGQGGASFLGTVAGSDSIIRQLKEAREDPTVRAVVLRINSPGGTSAASEEIGYEVKKTSDAGKPVVVSMSDVAASGGYWVSAYADRILANGSTTTGSIGVISQIVNYSELYDRVGIEYITIKSGEFKDMGSDARDPTEKELQILQEMVDDIFDQFVEVVADGRNMSEDRVRELADGRVYSGRQALELGLVDEIGNYYQAIQRAAELAGIDGSYSVFEYSSGSWWDMFFGLSGAAGIGTPQDGALIHTLLLIYEGVLP